MKKLLISLTFGMSMLLLTACAELPEGVSEEFHRGAIAIFTEVDDDTMELEVSDRDDVSNLSLLKANADSEPELTFVESVEKMVAVQNDVVKNSDGALEEYLKARKNAMDSMNLGDEVNFGDEEKFQVTKFQFMED